MFLNTLQWVGKRFVGSVWPRVTVEDIEPVEHNSQPIPFRQSERAYGWDSADAATTRTSSIVLFRAFFRPRTIGESDTVLPFHTDLIDDGVRLPSNPNNRTTTIDWSYEWNGEWIVENCSTRRIPKSKQPKALRQTVNRKADRKRYGEAVDHFKRFGKSESVQAKPTAPIGNSLTTADDLNRRNADGLANYLATFEDGGLRWLALHDDSYRQPSKNELGQHYDEHGDLKPREVLSLGRLGRRSLSKRKRKQLEIVRESLGDVAAMLASGYLPSEVADSLSVSRQAVSNRIAKARRLGEDVPADTLPDVWMSTHRFDLPMHGPTINANQRALLPK